jgi:hypothetical protein
MTANNASSAPTNLPDEPNESNDPSDEDDDTKNEVEEFFANLSYAEDDEPVRILANMMSDDLLMIPGATNSASPALPEPRGENLHTLRNLSLQCHGHSRFRFDITTIHKNHIFFIIICVR